MLFGVPGSSGGSSGSSGNSSYTARGNFTSNVSNNSYWIDLVLDPGVSWNVELIVDGNVVGSSSGSGSQNVSISYVHPVSRNSTYQFRVNYSTGSSSVVSVYGPYSAYVDFVGLIINVIWPIDGSSYTEGYRLLNFEVSDDFATTITCSYNITGPISYSNIIQLNNPDNYSTILFFSDGNYHLNITCNDSTNLRNVEVGFYIRETRSNQGSNQDQNDQSSSQGNQSQSDTTTDQTNEGSTQQSTHNQTIDLPNQNDNTTDTNVNQSTQNQTSTINQNQSTNQTEIQLPNNSTQQNTLENTSNRENQINQQDSGSRSNPTQNIITTTNGQDTNYPRQSQQPESESDADGIQGSIPETTQNNQASQGTENSNSNQRYFDQENVYRTVGSIVAVVNSPQVSTGLILLAGSILFLFRTVRVTMIRNGQSNIIEIRNILNNPVRGVRVRILDRTYVTDGNGRIITDLPIDQIRLEGFWIMIK
ncbi:MAG: hypothetical protein N3C61_01515 [Candidatus Micrarchaeota archaeon]|nr:hypothetical protein [Candidatus Micrarchaeota archaeon]